MSGSSVDARPGCLVWAKVGDWPHWPARVVTFDEVPERIRRSLEGEKGVLIRFFEEPPKL
jgi:hypothetical protein